MRLKEHLHTNHMPAATSDTATNQSYQNTQKIGELGAFQSQEHLNAILRAAPIGVCFIDENGVAWVNAKMCEISGYAFDELVGKSPAKLFYDPGLFPHMSEDLKSQILQHGTVTFQSEFLRKDSVPFDVLLTFTALDTQDYSRGLTMTVLDISEKNELAKKVLRAQKMDIVGRLANGIIHDLNNQLAAVSGFAELIEEIPIEHKTLDNYIKYILGATKKAAHLTNKLLAFSRKDQLKFRVTDIHGIIKDVRILLKHTLERNISVQILNQAETSTALVDPELIQTALLNLALNGRDAMSETGGTLSIETHTVILDERFCTNNLFDLSPGEYVRIDVADTGVGIEKNTADHLFEPFFTTKNPELSTGLGLAAVFSTMKSHGGAVEVKSKPGKGSVFTLYLKTVTTEKRESAIQETEPCEGKILLCDDEDMFRKLSSTMLKKIGYSVLTYANGFEALQEYKAHWKEIDLVIMDKITPVMDGITAFDEMQKVNPEVKGIMISGCNLEYESKKISDHGFVGFLQKPFLKKDLVEVLEQVRHQ